jgi:putative membrane protein
MSKTLRTALIALTASGLANVALAGEPSSDAAFVKEAASGAMMEVELGRAAAQQATDTKVRAYGQMLASDHGRAQEALKSAAARAGLSVPTAMEPQHRAQVDRLSRLEGREFDQAYMKAMLDDHQTDVEKFRQQAQEGETEIDRWAAQTLPTLESHLSQARTLSQAVGGSAAMSSGGDGDRPQADVAAPPL